MNSPPSFQLTSLALRNIRRFDELTIELSRRSKSGPVPRLATVLIGRNGTCKSTVLRSLAIGLAFDSEANALLESTPGSFVGPRSDEGQIEIGLMDRQTGSRVSVNTRLGRHKSGKQFVKTREFPGLAEGEAASFYLGESTFLYGYGPARGNSGPVESRYDALNATATLFSNARSLIDPELALRRLHDHLGEAKYERTMQGIKRAIGLPASDSIEIKRGGGVVVTSKRLGTIPLGALADGHRVPLGMIFDLFHWAMQTGQVTPEGGVRGILLVDEVEQHLHPALQAQVMRRFRTLFPELQIIASTHSPLVALSLKPEELIVLKNFGDDVRQLKNVPDFSAFTADDMLAHERLFDAPIQAPEVQVKTQRYQQLIGAKRRTRAQNRELAGLAAEMSSKSPGADDPQLDALLSKLRSKFGV
jgi:hypothetical protein